MASDGDFYFIYLDETGDDGWPKYSSELFVITAVYFPYSAWQALYDQIHSFRAALKRKYSFPVKLEMHTRNFVLNKYPYKELGHSNERRKEIFEEYIKFISNLEIKAVNVCIDKSKLDPVNYGSFEVLDCTLRYCIQRVHNDLTNNNKDSKAIIITDEGRIGKMTRTIRKMKKYNLIPSKIHEGTYQNELKTIIEDPLPKKSQQSYFIQLSDMISYLIYVHLQAKHHNRFKEVFPDFGVGEGYLDQLKTKVLNLKASPKNKYGIYCYPK